MPPNDELIKLLAAEAESEGLVFDDSHQPPERGEPPEPVEDWFPDLTDEGLELFHCQARYILCHGERGGGKTIAVLHKLMKHAYDNDGAVVCITTLTRTAGTVGGAWTKLQTYVIPEWVEGLGLEGEGKNGEIVQKMDDARNRYFWIKNAHGGWSMFFLRSMLHGEHIAGRIKGMEFTAFFFDELTETDAPEYFTKPIQQLNRLHPQTIKHQFYIGACNPAEEGEDHWVWQQWFTGFEATTTGAPRKKREYYAVFHFPFTKNKFLSAEEKQVYQENLYDECRLDPTAYDRLVLGKWTKKRSGKGLFKDYFDARIHVKGDAAKRQFIIPKGRVIDIGYDTGTANSAISFLQRHVIRGSEMWVAFDEIVKVDRYVPLPQLVPMLLELMDYWCERAKTPFHFNHISDAAAFDQMRPDGSYDARTIEGLVFKNLIADPQKYSNLKHLISFSDSLGHGHEPQPVAVHYQMVACPKPAGSILQRSKMMAAKLQAREFVVSARCEKIIEMFEDLPSDLDKGVLFPNTKSRHKHAFDSTTYPMFHYEMGGRLVGPLSNVRVEFLDLTC